MSWGIRITILYVGFIVMILFLVFKTMGEKVDLVSADYYQNELKFQDQVDRQNESASLAEQPLITATGKNVEVKFPGAVAAENISGTIKFYRPSDSSRDFTVNVQPDATGVQLFSQEKFVKGIYQVQISWSADGKKYYNEISFYFP
jgi:hypothetical protein